MSKKIQIASFVIFLAFAATLWAYAQTQPKPGHVYVISNIGSFGEGVYKVGMTQRVDTELRVRELGDASVPFPFDIHAMIATDDPRGLERKVHDDLEKYSVNKVNNRKEFYRTDLDTIVATIKNHHDQPFEVTREATASEYRKSLIIETEHVFNPSP